MYILGRKTTKKIAKVLLWIIAIFIALDLLIVALIFVPPIQSAIVHSITDMLSKKWKSEISIGKINLTPFLTLKASDVVLKDLEGNEMIDVSQLKAHLNYFKISPVTLIFKQLELDGAKVTIRKYKGNDTVNIARWAENFKTDKPSTGFLLRADRMVMTHSVFTYIDDNQRKKNVYKDGDDIDFAFFEIKDINFYTKDFTINKDDISAQFTRMAFKQYGGFEMINGSGNFRINSHNLIFNNAALVTPNSRLFVDLVFDYDNWSSYGSFVDSIRMDVDISPSTLCIRDIAYFASSLKGMDNSVVVTGKAKGTVNNASLKNFYLHYGSTTSISGDFVVQKITDFKNAYFDLNIINVNINVPELALITLPKGKKLKIPNLLTKLKNSQLNGFFIGGLTDFKTDLKVSTGVGDLTASINTMERENNMFFKANITSPNFNLGRLLGKSKEFGVVSLDSKMEGSMKSPKKYSNVESSIEADLKGKISRFDLLGYAISDIYFDGFYQDKKYDGTLISYDSNCQFNFTGLVDLTRSSPNFQTYISFKRFAIGKMAQYMPKVDSTFAAGFDKFIYFAQQNPKFALSFDSLEFNLNGEKLEGLNGFVGVDGLTISNHDKSVKGGRFRFTAINTASGLHKFILSASVMNATLTTNYPLNSVLDSLVEIGYRYFPNILPEREIVNKSFPKNINTAEEEKDQFFNFYAETYNSRELLGILFPTISLAPHAIVDIRFSTLEQHDSISVIIPAFAMRDKFIIRNLALAGNELAGGILNLQVTTDTLNIDNSNNNFSFKQIVLKTKTQDNQILYDLSWISPEAISSKSSMLLGSIDALNKNNIVIKTSKSAIYLKDFLWKFSDQNAVILGDHYIKFENLTVGNQDSYITLNGTLSQKEEDNLNVKVQNVDISLVNYFIKNLSFGGDVSASMDIKMVNNNRFIGGKLLASNFVFNDEKMGNLFLVTALGKKGSLGFSGGLFGREEPLNSNIVETYTIEQYRNEKIKLANLSGYYFSDKKLLHVKADIDTLHIGFLAPFLASFSNDISGVASGELSFISSPDSTYFDGVVHVKSANMGIAPLGTVYKIEKQDIIFDQKGFEFKNLVVKDKFNNVGYLNGYIHHQMFKDLDLNLQVKTDRLMVLNTSKDPSTSFYGDGFVSGTVTIQGGTDQLYFKGTNLTTLSGTKFFLPITSSESVSETGNIRFKTDSLQKQMIKTESEPGSTALAFDFIFDITKDAEIQVDLFSIGGTLRGRCTGPLKLTYNNETDLNLYGNLSMESGIFLLSLKDLLNAKFNIAPGGTVNFNGPVADFSANISAFYSAKTSLATIIPQEDVGSSLSRTQVNAYIHLNGELMQYPDISFSFELPNSSSEINTLFYNAIDTTNKDNLSKQFFYFVFSNQFLPNDAGTGSISPGLESSGIGLLTSMVNNFISQQFKYGDLGIVFKEANQSNAAEYGINANVPFLNDRIVFETSLGYYDNRNSSQGSQGIRDFYGDFSLEYLITPQGNWKIKVYNFSDQYSTENIETVYGVGLALVYKQEFNNRKDFIETFRRKDKKKKKKSPDPNHHNQVIKNE